MENIFTTFISRFGKRLSGAQLAVPSVTTVSQDEEIPRYPPFMKGLPAAPVERILSTQAELIQAIEQALALPDDLYQRIALPVIARYAAFSHLLPASEVHHHRGAGGLFRHGLEVAHWASMASQGCLFATQATPKERKSQELRWRLAVCFAGLLHDIGKPVSDMAVVDRHGQHTWNPCDENLTDWAEQNRIDRYFLRWRENRHKRHEQFSALVIERVLTRESRAYILEPGPDIMQAMLETIHGLDRGSKLYELVMQADRKSVERDMKAHYHGMDMAMGMPVEKYLFDAMRRLIKSGQWTANEKGARIWRFKDGMHIVWRTAVKEILETLDRDKVPGIPRDEDTLADILIECGMAIPKSMPDGRRYRYWRMQPQSMNVMLYMLRLSSVELIYSSEPPVVVDGVEIGEPVETESSQMEEYVSHASGKDEQVATILEPVAEIVDPSDPEISEPLAYSGNPAEPELGTEFYDVELLEELGNTIPAIQDNSDQAADIANEITQLSDKSKPATKANALKAVPVIQPQAESINISAEKWLQDQGLAGEWLIQLAEAINSGHKQLGVDLLETQDKWLLAFPATPQFLNVEPSLFIKTLEEKAWLVTDILSPMRKVQQINQVRGVLLASEPSGILKQLLTVQVQSLSDTIPATAPVKSAQTGKPKRKSSPASTANKDLQPDQVTLPGKGLSDNAETGETRQPQNKAKPEKSKNKAGSKSLNTKQPTAKQASVQKLNNNHEHPKPIAETTQHNASLTYQKEIDAFVQLAQRSRSKSDQQTDNAEWINVDDDIDTYLENNPAIKRFNFMRELGVNDKFRSHAGSLQLRCKP